MFDINELTKNFIITVGLGLLGYEKMSNLESYKTYIPPTRTEVIWAYQHAPLFNKTVDIIVSHLRRHTLQINGICYCDMEKPIKAEICKKCRGIVVL